MLSLSLLTTEDVSSADSHPVFFPVSALLSLLVQVLCQEPMDHRLLLRF
jgi:hypothetical protein